MCGLHCWCFVRRVLCLVVRVVGVLCVVMYGLCYVFVLSVLCVCVLCYVLCVLRVVLRVVCFAVGVLRVVCCLLLCSVFVFWCLL